MPIYKSPTPAAKTLIKLGGIGLALLLSASACHPIGPQRVDDRPTGQQVAEQAGDRAQKIDEEAILYSTSISEDEKTEDENADADTAKIEQAAEQKTDQERSAPADAEPEDPDDQDAESSEDDEDEESSEDNEDAESSEDNGDEESREDELTPAQRGECLDDKRCFRPGVSPVQKPR